MNINIAKEIRDKTPDFCIGLLTFSAKFTECSNLDQSMDVLENDIKESFTLSSLIKTPKILAARDAYKLYGKDPSRYRLAVESLYRRIIKGNKVYRINNLVDIGNYLSLKLQKSTAVLDFDKISGDILIRLGKNEPYHGIARGAINIENIPVYVDQIGPFGSTTSDTERTMITKESTNILLFIISFTGANELEAELDLSEELFSNYADATNFTKQIIK